MPAARFINERGFFAPEVSHRAQAISGMPPGIPYIVGNERRSALATYGILRIAIFLTGHLRTQLAPCPDGRKPGREWQHNFMAASYFFPIVGAILSDWLFGKYRMIIAVQLLYCVGMPCWR